MLTILLQTVYAAVATFCFAILFNIGRRYLAWSAVGGGIGWFAYGLLLYFGHHIFAYFAASMAVAVYSEIMARVLKAPVTTFVICGAIPLVPGGGMYNTMLEIVRRQYSAALSTGIDTLVIAGTIAVGIIFVSSGMKMLRHGRGRA